MSKREDIAQMREYVRGLRIMLAEKQYGWCDSAGTETMLPMDTEESAALSAELARSVAWIARQYKWNGKRRKLIHQKREKPVVSQFETPHRPKGCTIRF